MAADKVDGDGRVLVEEDVPLLGVARAGAGHCQLGTDHTSLTTSRKMRLGLLLRIFNAAGGVLVIFHCSIILNHKSII